MSDQFLTVREAAILTGKSPSSIRRILYPIIQQDQHADRQHIQPSVEEALTLRMKGENFAWRVSEELLHRAVPPESVPEKGSGTLPKGSHQDETPLLAMLRRELDIKNQQISQQGELIGKQMELISGLSERLREGNVLIGSLQQRMSLADGSDTTRGHPVEAVESNPPPEKTGKARRKVEKGTEATPKTVKPRKRFLSRLFG
jgi:hypothetical protein